MNKLAIAIITAIAGGATFALANKGVFDFMQSNDNGGSNGNPPIGRDNTGQSLPDGSFPLRFGGRSKLIQVMQLALLNMRDDVAKHIKLTGGADGVWGNGTSKALVAAGYSSAFISSEDFANITKASETLPDIVDAVIFEAKGEAVNLRDCPSVNTCPGGNTNSLVILQVRSGEPMTFLGEKQEEFRNWSGRQYWWYKVRTANGTEGWVRNDVVRVIAGELSGGLDGLDCVTTRDCEILAESHKLQSQSGRYIGQMLAEHEGQVLVRLTNGETGIIDRKNIKLIR